MDDQGFVYIMGSASRVLYVGSTYDLEKRVYEHKNKLDEKSFTARYNINKLLYFETTGSVANAINREKQIKGLKREKKLRLIEWRNPYYKDAASDWYDN